MFDMRRRSPDCPNIMPARRQTHHPSPLRGESVSASRRLSRGDYGVIISMSTCVLQCTFCQADKSAAEINPPPAAPTGLLKLPDTTRVLVWTIKHTLESQSGVGSPLTAVRFFLHHASALKASHTRTALNSNADYKLWPRHTNSYSTRSPTT